MSSNDRQEQSFVLHDVNETLAWADKMLERAEEFRNAGNARGANDKIRQGYAVLNDQACAYHSRYKYYEAEPLLRKLIKIGEMMPLDEPVRPEIALLFLSDCCYALGKFQEAAVLREQVIECLHRIIEANC